MISNIKIGDVLYFVKFGNKYGRYIIVNKVTDDGFLFNQGRLSFFTVKDLVYIFVKDKLTGELVPSDIQAGYVYKNKSNYLGQEKLVHLTCEIRNFSLGNMTELLTFSQAQKIWSIMKKSKCADQK